MQMRMLVRWIVIAVLMLSASVLAQGQNLVGQWQGTLAIQGKELRIVFVIATTGQGNTLGATLYSIDQGAGGIGATIAAQGGNVKITVAPLNATFEGKLSADGNAIGGTFTQGGAIPLTLARANKE